MLWKRLVDSEATRHLCLDLGMGFWTSIGSILVGGSIEVGDEAD